MNIGHDHDPDTRFDDHLRQLHAQAVDRVPPRTLWQLRPQRTASRAPATKRLHAWPLAATCAIALVAGGLFLHQPALRNPAGNTPVATAPARSAPVAARTDNDPGDVYAALDESPELYVWLASNDTENLVTE